MDTVQKLQENWCKTTGLVGYGLVAAMGKPMTKR